jgi:hypothetical protein
MYIRLFGRSDRMGSNITCHIIQIIFAHKNGYYINLHANRNEYGYADTAYLKSLFKYIDSYNQSLKDKDPDIAEEDETKRVDIYFHHDWVSLASFTTVDVQSDLVSYFKEHIYNSVLPVFEEECLLKKYTVPFDPSKTIVVHLRIDDQWRQGDYDGTICSTYYNKKIVNGEKCICEFGEQANHQAPLGKDKLDRVISEAKAKYPTYDIKVVTSPISNADFLGYDTIKSEDPAYDLFLLCKAEVIVLSRSTFALSSVFFSNKRDVFSPSWGHFVCCGLNTKFDKTGIKYFY